MMVAHHTGNNVLAAVAADQHTLVDTGNDVLAAVVVNQYILVIMYWQL